MIDLEPKRGKLISVGRFFKDYPVFPAVLLGTLIIMGLLSIFWSPHHPVRGDLRDRHIPPAWQEGGEWKHPFGTDQQGRDVLTRIMHGARVSLTFATATMITGLGLGLLFGCLAGYYGGHIDEIIMRFVDLANALPFILAALVVVSIFGSSFLTLLVIISLFSWGGFARQIRGEILRIREMDYVALARVAGASPTRIIIKHLIPGIINTTIVVATLGTGGIILAESTLSFLGVGIPPPNPAWGSMVAQGREYIDSSWWIAVIPGLGIACTVLSLNFIGDWLRDKLDPMLRQQIN